VGEELDCTQIDQSAKKKKKKSKSSQNGVPAAKRARAFTRQRDRFQNADLFYLRPM
jgi:hypothetical protein